MDERQSWFGHPSAQATPRQTTGETEDQETVQQRNHQVAPHK
jgi:hypothetical protein